TAQMGGVCTLINTTCCTYIDQSGQIETDIQKLWEQGRILHEVAKDNTSWGFQGLWDKLTFWLPNFGWLKQLFACVLILIAMGITEDSYVNWKKHQLRQQIESGKYLKKS
ncbi:ERVV2 protein, partial [Psilopogon haemacephalus]|nr:ERVV2 protein [Psilopogon haemacephalus]